MKPKQEFLIAFCILLSVIVFWLYTFVLKPTAQDNPTVEILATQHVVRFYQLDNDLTWHIQCFSSCEQWLALDGIVDIYQGFTEQCEAINFYKRIMHIYYQETLVLLPCPSEGV